MGLQASCQFSRGWVGILLGDPAWCWIFSPTAHIWVMFVCLSAVPSVWLTSMLGRWEDCRKNGTLTWSSVELWASFSHCLQSWSAGTGVPFSLMGTLGWMLAKGATAYLLDSYTQCVCRGVEGILGNPVACRQCVAVNLPKWLGYKLPHVLSTPAQTKLDLVTLVESD